MAPSPVAPAGSTEGERPTAARRGRPSTGARERILAAATETMKEEGYAGLTVAKVAARAGEAKALINYHYGSKQGLVAAVGRELAETITGRALAQIEGSDTVEDLTRGIAVAIEKIADEDPRMPRLYFDLAAVSVVDPDVRATIQGINGVWREVVHDRLKAASDAPKPRDVPAVALLIIAGVQGIALERVEREPGPELKRVREMFVRSVAFVAKG